MKSLISKLTYALLIAIVASANLSLGNATQEVFAFEPLRSESSMPTLNLDSSLSPLWFTSSLNTYAGLGASVNSAGDVNGDGFDDILIGSPGHWEYEFSEGAAFLYFGSETGPVNKPNWSVQSNQTYAGMGGVDTAGDVNGDGYDDILVSASGYTDGQEDEGVVFAYYGSATGPSTNPDWIGQGNIPSIHFGTSVSTAGDVNNDGYDDIVIGARYFENGETDEGAAFVYMGSSNGLSTSPAWIREGNEPNAGFGYKVNDAGDVNGDGHNDVLVSSYNYIYEQLNGGKAYLFLGGSGGLAPNPSWVGTSGIAMDGYGQAASSAGDVNGDGYDDILVGAPAGDNELVNGKAYLYLGSPNGPGLEPDWTAQESDPTTLFGISVSNIGDFNNDGYDDIIVGDSNYYLPSSRSIAGMVFIYFGSPSGPSIHPDITFTGGMNNSAFGSAVGPAGRVNSDRSSEILVGAPNWSNPGRAVLLFGSQTNNAVTRIVTNTKDSGAGSLRQTIADSDPADTIKFDPSLAGQTIALSSTITITEDLIIDGSNLVSHVQFSGDSDSDGLGDISIFQISDGSNVELTGLDIVKGRYTSAATGGAVNNDGNLIVTNCSFVGNSGDQGGAIHNAGGLTVSNSSFISNTAIEGGAILSDAGTVTFISNSSFTSNTAVAQAGLRGAGGAVANAGTLTVTDSDFSENSANGEGGGALFNVSPGMADVRDSAFTGNSTTNGGGAINNYSGEVQLSNVTLRNNTAFAFGGGIYNDNKLAITDSSLIDNVAGDGGGVLNAPNGNLNVINSTFMDNRAVLNGSGTDGAAGAIVNLGMLTITESTFDHNFSEGGGGAIVNSFDSSASVHASVFTGNSTPRDGGAIFNYSGALTITDSFFSSNSAKNGGAINVSNDPAPEEGSEVTIEKCTFSENTAVYVAGGIQVFSGRVTIDSSTFTGNSTEEGGGVVNLAGSVQITNSTFHNNSSTAAPLGGIYNSGLMNIENTTIAEKDSGLYNASDGSLTLQNTILANSTSGVDCYNEGTLTSATNNLIEVNGSGEFACGTPVSSADPQLGPLTDNGGSTQTMALLPGSPAIDAGDSATCEPADQRGVARPYGAGCDLGAFELEYGLPVGTATTVSCASPVTYGSSTTCTATVTRAMSGYTPTGTLSWATDANGTFSGSPCTLSGSGGSASCSVIYTPDAVGDGVHQITATYGSDAHFSGSNGSQDVAVNTKALVPSITAGNKVYDRTTSATLLTRSLSGVVGADAVSLTGGTASFSDKNAGNGKTVTGSGFSLSGAQAGNYRLSPTTATTTANITLRSLTVSAMGVNKVYDGTAGAAVTLTTNAVTGDAVTAAYTSASFATPDAGDNKSISVSGISISGADAGNYSLSSTTASASADIAPKPLTVTADNKSKVVGENDPAFTYTTSGFVGSDTFTTAPTCSVPAAHDEPGSYEIVCENGFAGHNYSVEYVNGALTVTSPDCFALTLSHTGQGSDPTPSPSNSTGCPEGQYQAGATVSLGGATPASGWKIGGWSGTQNDASTASTNTLTMPAKDHSASVIYFEIAPQVRTLQSIAAQDGWLLESTERSNKGGTLDKAAATFSLGDNAQKKQYRAILSFSTKGLPDNAVITRITLKIRKQAIVGGGNPVNLFQGFLVDVKQGFFGPAAGLQTNDFQAKPNKTIGPFKPALKNGWYTIDLTPAEVYINKQAPDGGLTQLRLRFKLDDNNNAAANYLSLDSGNAPAGSRPQLIIEYYVP